MSISFEIKTEFKINPEFIYKAWLSSEAHSEMTGGEAKCSEIENESFTAWDGYISGKNIELTPNKKIVQSWRTTEFSDADPDSKITLELNETNEGCELKLTHIDIPEGQPDYKQGWIEHYFEPMKDYFEG